MAVLAAAVVVLAAPRAWADPCDAAVETVGRAAHTLACRELRGLDDTLGRCTSPAGSPRARQLGDARWQLSVALGRCTCDGALEPSALAAQLSGARNAYALARLVPAVSHTRACRGASAALAKVEAGLEKLQASKAYCDAAGLDLRPRQDPAPTCRVARLQRAAVGYWLACPNAANPASLIEAFDELQAKVCVAPGPPPSCDDTLAIAEQLRRTGTPAAERQLWNLVTTRLVAAATPGAPAAARSCANGMLATAVPASAMSGRLDEAIVAAVMLDPQLSERLTGSLRSALTASGGAPKEVAKLLDDHADLAQVVAAASRLEDDKRRRFFAVAGGLGRALEAVRAFSAFEQNARGIDVVVDPRPRECHYGDFVNVLFAGLTKAAPAHIVNLDSADAKAKVAGLIAARERSCGKDAAPGAGCGAVIAVHIEDRAGNRGGGSAELRFIAPGGNRREVVHKTTTIQLRDFQAGCGADSEESAAALRLVFDLQFALATNPNESIEIHDPPARAEVCGLRALAPTALRTEPYDGKGLHLRGPDLADELLGPTDGAREVLQAWLPAGAVDAKDATATLRFSSAPYRDNDRNRGMKLEAELSLRGRPTASFAAVVLDDAPSCLAPLDERFVQAGRMIGNEAGLFLVQPPSDSPSPLPKRRRWVVPLAIAGDAVLIAGGLWMVNSAVANENTATAFGLDPAVPNNRLAWGRGMLLTAGAGALAIAIYAAVQ